MKDPPKKRGPRKKSKAPHFVLVTPTKALTGTTITVSTTQLAVNEFRGEHTQYVGAITIRGPIHRGCDTLQAIKGSYHEAPMSETPEQRLAACKRLRARERALREAEHYIQSESWHVHNHHYWLLVMMDPY